MINDKREAEDVPKFASQYYHPHHCLTKTRIFLVNQIGSWSVGVGSGYDF